MSDIRRVSNPTSLSGSTDDTRKLNIHVAPLDAKSKTCLEDLVGLCKQLHVDLSSPSLTDKLIEWWHMCVHQVLSQNGLNVAKKNMKESFSVSPFDHAFAILKHHLLAHKCDHDLVDSLHDLIRDHCDIHSPCPKSDRSKIDGKNSFGTNNNKMSSSSCTTCSVAGSSVPATSKIDGHPPSQPLDSSKNVHGSLGKQMRPKNQLKPVIEHNKNNAHQNTKTSNTKPNKPTIERENWSNIKGDSVRPSLIKSRNLVNVKSYDLGNNLSKSTYIVSNNQMKPVLQRRHTKEFGDKLQKPKHHATASSASLSHHQSKKEAEFNKANLMHAQDETDHEWDDEVYDEVSMMIPRTGGLAAVASVFRRFNNRDIQMSHEKHNHERMIGERTIGNRHQQQNMPKQKHSSSGTASTIASSKDSFPQCTSGNLRLIENRMRVPTYSAASYRFKSRNASKQKVGECAAARAQVLKAAARAAVVLDQNPLGAGNRLRHNFSRSRLDIDSLYEFNGVLHCSEEIGIPCKSNMVVNNPHLTHVIYGNNDEEYSTKSKSSSHNIHQHNNVTLNTCKKGFTEKNLPSSCKRDVDLERFEREKFGEDIPKSVHNCGVCHSHVL